MKIAILGGSGVATPQLVDELGRRLGPDLTVALIGRDHEKLRVVAAAAARRCPGLRITAAPSAAAGIPGADRGDRLSFEVLRRAEPRLSAARES